MLTLTDITTEIEQELQKIISNINKVDSIIVFSDAEFSTNCSISVSIHFHHSSSLNNKVTQNFWSQTDLYKTKRKLINKEVLDNKERKKKLYKCLINIRNMSKSEDLTDTHQFLEVL